MTRVGIRWIALLAFYSFHSGRNLPLSGCWPVAHKIMNKNWQTTHYTETHYWYRNPITGELRSIKRFPLSGKKENAGSGTFHLEESAASAESNAAISSS